ncbi:MAG: heavy-metal-associated domain-containing protein [Flavobacteriales bacterium]|nr:heavy-metal-associated domain-containing protein [Flavobacteriales bacterium]
MLTNKIVRLHQADEHRLDELLFLKDEVRFFKKAMSNYFLKLLHQNALEEAERLSSEIIEVEKVIQSVLQRLNILEKEISFVVCDPSDEGEGRLLSFGQELEVELREVEEHVRDLKRRLFIFLEHTNVSEREWLSRKGIKRLREVKIYNLKCGGCANTIIKELSRIKGVTSIEVEEHESIVRLEASSETVMGKVKTRLTELGYPPIEGKNTMGRKAKSYVSCMKGRINEPTT